MPPDTIAGMNTSPVYDLRALAPWQRHALAFQTFDDLAEGEAFELINDHEPRGLLIQFAEQRTNAFDWQVLPGAPGDWRIRVTRVADAFAPTVSASLPEPAACCGCGCSR